MVDEICGQAMPSKSKFVQIKGASSTIEACKVAVKRVVGSEIKMEEVGKALESSGLDTKQSQAFQAVVEARRKDVKAFLDQDASSISPSTLKDFDWSLKMVMASDKLAEIANPTLVLSLDLKGSDGSSKLVQFELSKESLDKLLSTCGDITKVVRQLTHFEK